MHKCNAKKILKENNLKITKQRLIILNEIIRTDTIFTANTFYKIYKNEIDLVTIYRILNIFLEKNIIREIPNTEEVKKYEMACMHNPVHPHFYCNKCKKLFCLDELKQSDINTLKKYAMKYMIENIGIQLSGLCSKCK